MSDLKITCTVKDCDSKVHCKDLCGAHYHRLVRYGSTNKPARKKRFCSLDTCDKPHYAKDFCLKHYQRWYKYGDPLELKGTPKGSGKPWINDQGYVVLPKSMTNNHPNAWRKGVILQHVMVMSEHLGRPLVSGENVHHKNGNRQDNRIENLELWSTNQPPGQRVEDKVTWAKEILALYDPGALNVER